MNDNNSANNAKACYIYCRVSTDEQAEDGYSLENQKRACTEYAKNQNFIVKNYFVDEGASARSIDRPKFQEMLEAIKHNHVDAVIIYKIDRFARNVGDFSNIRKQFRTADIKLLSVMESGDVTNGLIGNIFASVAEWESEVNGQRTKDTMTQKYREGWWPGWAPQGYLNINKEGVISNKVENGNELLIMLNALGRPLNPIELDPVMAPYIKKAFELYSTGGYSYLKLTKFLHKKGLRTRNGNTIAISTMQKMLTNPFYYGLMRWGKPQKMESIGSHEPLISKKLFDVCQLVASRHGNFVTRERKHDFLLRGVVFCAQCGQRYTAEWHAINSKKYDKIAYYHCAKRKPCKSPYVSSDDLEKQVLRHLKGMKFSKGFTDAITRQITKYLKNRDKEEAKERNLLIRGRNKFITQRKTLEERLLDNTIDRDTFKRLHNTIQTDIDDADEKIATLEISRKFDFDLLEEILALSRNIPKTYEKAPPFLKRKCLHFFFNQIMVDKKNIVSTSFSPLVEELIKQQQVILTKNWLPE